MARLLVLSTADRHALTALDLLSHQVHTLPAAAANLVSAPEADLVLVDATGDLVAAKSLCRLIRTTGLSAPLFAIVTEGALSVLGRDWGIDDFLLATAGPGEIEARIRLALTRSERPATSPARVQASGITIDEQSYSARAHGKPLDLTFKEFQLLHFLASHPGRAFTREQLLSEVWGYDYFGGTRTVDVHVRRLRAKLGDLEQVIGTVRNVGYRFEAADDVPPVSVS